MAPSNLGAVRLRRALESAAVVTAPGCATALEALIAERTGNVAVYMSGAATNLSQYGYFDGLLGMAEMVENAERLVGATDLPVIADADTGYGGIHNVQRTVRAYDRAGVAGIQLEDQRWPKRCGHAAGKTVVSRADARARIRAAVDVRDNEERDIAIIGRTDAYGAANGDWDEHVARGRLFAELGVDRIMPEMPDPSRTNAIRYAEAIHETHPEARFLWNYSSNVAWTEQADPLTVEELGELGYDVVIVSLFGMHAAVVGLVRHMRAFAESGVAAQWHLEDKYATLDEFETAGDVLFDLGNFEEYQGLEEQYLSDASDRYAASEGYRSE